MMTFQNSPTLGEETMTQASKIRRGGGTGRAGIEISMMLATAVVLLGTGFAAAQGLEPHQARAIHHPSRHRRRRRPDGTLHPGRGRQEQPDETADHYPQQG